MVIFYAPEIFHYASLENIPGQECSVFGDVRAEIRNVEFESGFAVRFLCMRWFNNMGKFGACLGWLKGNFDLEFLWYGFFVVWVFCGMDFCGMEISVIMIFCNFINFITLYFFYFINFVTLYFFNSKSLHPENFTIQNFPTPKFCESEVYSPSIFRFHKFYNPEFL